MINIHVDLSVDPAKEQEMVRYFQTVYRPTAQKFDGYIDIHMLKLRKAFVGTAPADMNYRFQLVYKSEELRLKWIGSDIHQEVWGAMEKFFTRLDNDILLFDAV